MPTFRCTRSAAIAVAVYSALLLAMPRSLFAPPPEGAELWHVCVELKECLGVAAKGTCIAGLAMCTPDPTANWPCGEVEDDGCSWRVTVNCLQTLLPVWCHRPGTFTAAWFSDCRGSCLFLAPGLCACACSDSGAGLEVKMIPVCISGSMDPE